jgi:hypothetical protein
MDEHPDAPQTQAIENLGYSDFDLSDTLIGRMSLASVVLGAKPLAAITLPGVGGSDAARLQAWCDAAAAQGFTCPTLKDGVSIDDAATALSLEAGGVDLSKTALSRVTLRTLDPIGTVLPDIPLRDTFLDNTPLGEVRLSDVSNAALSASIDCTALHSACPGSYTLGSARSETPSAIRSTAKLADLTVGLPASSTVGDLLMSLIDPAYFPWEDIPLTGVDLIAAKRAAGHWSGGVIETERTREYAAVFTVGLDGGPEHPLFRDARITIDLPATTSVEALIVYQVGPGGVTSQSSAAVTAGNHVEIPLGDVRSGTTIWGMAVPSVRLNTGAATWKIAAGSDPDASHVPSLTQSVQYTDPGPRSCENCLGFPDSEGSDDPSFAPVIAPDTLYFGHLDGTNVTDTDEDYFKIPAAPPGSRIDVSLDPVNVNADMGMFKLTPVTPQTATGAEPATAGLDSDPLPEDSPTSPTEAGDASAPQEGPAAPDGYSTVDVSAHPGNANEDVSTTADGSYIVKVASPTGQRSVGAYNLRYTIVAPTPTQRCPAVVDPGYADPNSLPNPGADLSAGTNSLFLVDRTRLESAYPIAGPGTFTKLKQFAEGDETVEAAPNVQGAVIELDKYRDYVQARQAADANPCSVDLVNDVVKEIGRILAAKLGPANSPLRNSVKSIVLVGSDDLLPFARVPDTVQRSNEATFEDGLRRATQPNGSACPEVQAGELDPCATPLSAAAFAHDLLTDDPYGDYNPIPWLDRYLYVPDVAVGRLVETPAQIDAALDQYRAPSVNGQLDLETAVTAGYGAWADGSQQITDTLRARGVSAHQLTPDSWTRADLLDSLFPTGGSSPKIAAINAHMDPTRLLTGSGETVSTTDYDFNRLAGGLLFTLGCHAGLNLPDRYLGSGADDWAQRLAGKAIYVANTGYGYADGDVVGLTERLLSLYANRIGGHETAGQALMYAKQAYLGGLGLYTNYDEKVMMQSTFYGLPMYTFASPVDEAPDPAPPITTTDPATGLLSASFDIDPDFATRTVDGETVTIADGEDPQVSPDRPTLPRTSEYATVPDATAHDAVITALTTDVTSIDPGIATANAVGAPPAEPNRYDALAFPSSYTNVTSYNTPTGVRQDLVLLPAHVDVQRDPVTGESSGTFELFTHTEVQVFYSESRDNTKPTITEPTVTRSGSSATFSVRAIDASGIARIVVLYQTTDGGVWHTLDSADGALT